MQVRVDKISKHYFKPDGTGFTALSELSLTIKPGEFVSLLGPSGCGKSTLLNIVAGLESPDGGRVQVGDQEVRGPGPDRVVIFQEAALFPWLTVLENVEFGLKMIGVSAAERREQALKCLKAVHLTRFTGNYPHELSGGMRQRVAIARGLAMDPRVLLMDEPFAALDEQTRILLHSEVQDLWEKTGKTIIFVTHNIREALFLSDRIFLFATRPGRIKQEFRVPVPRPRREADPWLVNLEAEILDSLKEEIEKVVREEIDVDYVLKKDSLLPDPARNMGRGI